MTERPAPWLVEERWEWIVAGEADGADLAGFAVEVRTSVTVREQMDIIERSNAIQRYSVEWLSMEPADRAKAEEAHDTPLDREWALLAPLVRDWNARGLDGEGNAVDVPPPSVAGPDAFYAIPAPALRWVWGVVIVGYRSLGKADRSPGR